MKRSRQRLFMHITVSSLAYVFVGVLGLVLFLSEAPPQVHGLFYLGSGILTAITLKMTNVFGYVPRLSRWIDRWFEAGVIAFLVAAFAMLAFNGELLVPALVSIPLR
jgi:hypothetical protein